MLEIKEIQIPLEVEKAMAVEAQSRRDIFAKQEKAESEAKAARTNYLAKELERMPSTIKTKRALLTSEHWY